MLPVFLFVLSPATLLADTKPTSNPDQPLGIHIMSKQEKLNQGYGDLTSKGTMILKKDGAKIAERTIIIKQLEGKDQKSSRSLLHILAPADLQGTSLLTLQDSGGKDAQWLYLPALKKVERISGGSKSGRFLGSEFIFEDFILPALQKNTYRHLITAPCTLVQCYVVESRPYYTTSAYAKKIMWIDSRDYTVQKVEFYNKKDELIKKAVFSDYKKFKNKFLKPMLVEMTNMQNGRSTELRITDLKMGIGLHDTEFTTQALSQQ